MDAFRIKTRITSETLQIPELKKWLGKDVEIIIQERSAQPSPKDPLSEKERYPLRGTVLRYDDPFGPAVPDSDWEANN
jgi:hypothetical protein